MGMFVYKEVTSINNIISLLPLLPADKGRSTVILNCEDYLEKCMDHINNGPNHLLKNTLIPKLKPKH